MSAVSRCPKCSATNPLQAKFCRQCGAPLLKLCTHCDKQIPASARFCPGCGHEFAQRPQPTAFVSIEHLATPAPLNTVVVQPAVPDSPNESAAKPPAIPSPDLAKRRVEGQQVLKKNLKPVWIAVSVLGALILLGASAIAYWATRASNENPQVTAQAQVKEVEPPEPPPPRPSAVLEQTPMMPAPEPDHAIAPQPSVPEGPAPEASESPTPTSPPSTVLTPGKTAIQVLRDIERGDPQSAMTRMEGDWDAFGRNRLGATSQERAVNRLMEASREMQANGGIVTIQTRPLKVTDRQVILQAVENYRNGNRHNNVLVMVRPAFEWKVLVGPEADRIARLYPDAPNNPKSPEPAVARVDPPINTGSQHEPPSNPPKPNVVDSLNQVIQSEIEKFKRCQGKWGTTPDCPKGNWKEGPDLGF